MRFDIRKFFRTLRPSTGGKNAVPQSKQPDADTSVNNTSAGSAPDPVLSSGVASQADVPTRPSANTTPEPVMGSSGERTPSVGSTAAASTERKDMEPPSPRDNGPAPVDPKDSDGQDTAVPELSDPVSASGEASTAPSAEDGTAANRTPEERAADLWDDAYDLVRKAEPGLIHAYESMITACDAGNGAAWPERRLSVWTATSETAIPETPLADRSARREWMKLTTDMWLEECNLGDSRNTKPNRTRSVTEIIGATVQVCPPASLAWVASWFALESLLRSDSQGKVDGLRTPLIHVISRINWYNALAGLVFWGTADDKDFDAKSSVMALTDLYKIVLEHLITVAVRGKLLEVKVEEAVKRIQDYEHVLASNLAKEHHLKSQLNQLFEQAGVEDRDEALSHSEPDDAASEEALNDEATELEQLLRKLGAAEQPLHEPDAKKSEPGQGLYSWARSTSQFETFFKWADGADGRVLWVIGSPGVGKSMLLHAAAHNLQTEHGDAEGGKRVAHFFCNDGGGFRERDAVSVVKSLISCVLRSQKSLRYHLESAFEDAKRAELGSKGDFYALSTILYSIIGDNDFVPTYFVVDSIELLASDGAELAERDTQRRPDVGYGQGLVDLMGLISATTAPPYGHKVKWLLSVDIKRFLGRLPCAEAGSRLQLNLDSHPDAIRKVVRDCAVSRLGDVANDKLHKGKLYTDVMEKLRVATPGNFIWLDAALAAIKSTKEAWNLPRILDELSEKSPTVELLYSSSKDLFDKLRENDKTFCAQILSTVSLAYRPLSVAEVVDLAGLPEEVDVSVIVDTMLSMFLEMREERLAGQGNAVAKDPPETRDYKLQYRRLSAREYIRQNAKDWKVVSPEEAHANMARRCLRMVLEHLHGCRTGGQTTFPSPSGGPAYMYAAEAWVRHLTEPGAFNRDAISQACHLLQDHVLEWLEMLDSEDALSDVLRPMAKLLEMVAVNPAGPDDDYDQTNLVKNIQDIIRFIRVDRGSGIEFSDMVGEEPSTDQEGTKNSRLRNNLLFVPTADPLKQRLLPRYYPWLSTAPVIKSRNNSMATCCLHVMYHVDWVRGCRFSPDGRMVASASDDGKVRLWNVETGELQRVFRNMESYRYVYGVDISRTGPETHPILVAHTADDIRIWDALTSRPLKNLSAVPKVSESGENSEEDEPQKDQEPPTEDHSTAFQGTFQGNSVDDIAISANGDRIAAVVDGLPRLWAFDGSSLTEITLESGDEDKSGGPVIRCIKFSPDGRYTAFGRSNDIVLSCSATGAIVHLLRGKVEEGKEEDSATASAAPQEDRRRDGHTGVILRLGFSPNSSLLLSTASDGTARVWDLHSGRTLAVLRCQRDFDTGAAVFSRDGKHIAMDNGGGVIAIWAQRSPDSWGSNNGEPYTRPHRVLSAHNTWVRSLDFSPTGNLLASSSSDTSLRIWDIDKAEEETTTDGRQIAPDVESSGRPRASEGGGHETTIRYVTMSTDQRIIASASVDGGICVWDGVTGKELCRGEHTNILSMAFSPDSKRLMSVSKDQRALIWKLELEASQTDTTTSMTPEHLLAGAAGHTDWIRGGAFSPDGRLVATASDDNTVRVWDIEGADKSTTEKPTKTTVMGEQDTKKVAVPVRVFKGHTDYVYTVAFSPNGARLASSGDDRRIMIWDLVEGDTSDKPKPDKTMSDSRVRAYMRELVFLPDGSRLFSVSYEGTIGVWDPDGPDGARCLIAVSPDAQNNWNWPMSIDKEHPDVLLTAHGAWPFDVSPAALEKAATVAAKDDDEAKPAAQLLTARPLPPSWTPFTIGGDNSRYIFCNNRKVISLPRQFYPPGAGWLTCRVQGRTVVIGCESGDVLLFRFSEDMRPGSGVKTCA